jgi:NAD(P)-dependent dehydrogenase (short-subunit alcohol dehydrogenase family)
LGILDSKTILITGGSLGIGLEVAKKCVEEGARVIISARNIDDLKGSIEELKKISNRGHHYYRVDVSQYKEVQKFAKWCSERFQEVNGLVNCAGIYGPIGEIHQVDMGKFSEAIQINFLGTVYICNAFIPLLKSASRKKIVNFSGGGAASPFANYSAYATSKIAIVRLTENISVELKDAGFDINCVAPGFVITRLHQQTLQAGPDLATQAFYENTKKQIENGGVPVEKAANLTAFLLSSGSDGITGKFISAPWDPWQEENFQNRLRTDKDFAAIRRIDDKTFFKKT